MYRSADCFGTVIFNTPDGVVVTAVPFGPFMLVAAWGSILGASGLGQVYLSSIGF